MMPFHFGFHKNGSNKGSDDKIYVQRAVKGRMDLAWTFRFDVQIPM